MNSKRRYQLTEKDILLISTLFGNLEDAIKEIIRRNPHNVAHDGYPEIAELSFYESVSRIFVDSDEEKFIF